jgi:hypothetical protein
MATNTCTGRVGAIITESMRWANDLKLQFSSQQEILDYINGCLSDIAEEGYFRKEGLIKLLANTEKYDLAALFTDYVDITNLIATDEDTDLTPHSDWGYYQEQKKRFSKYTEVWGYFIDGQYLYVSTPPTVDKPNAIKIFYSYLPASVGCTSSTSPPTPAAFDCIYSKWALAQICNKDSASPTGLANFQRYWGLYNADLKALMNQKAPPQVRMRPYR